MFCPACQNKMSQITHRGVTLDICKNGCGGIWFDNFELGKFDEQSEDLGDVLSCLTPVPDVKIDLSKRQNCPVCAGVVMMRHYFSPNDKIIVDQCPACGGIWLDAGELVAIRSSFETEAQREKATEEYLTRVSKPLFEKLKEEEEKELIKYQRIANVFRLICPSYYRHLFRFDHK